MKKYILGFRYQLLYYSMALVDMNGKYGIEQTKIPLDVGKRRKRPSAVKSVVSASSPPSCHNRRIRQSY